MEFLLEPMEMGSDLDDIVTTQIEITCDVGYTCKTGFVKP